MNLKRLLLLFWMGMNLVPVLQSSSHAVSYEVIGRAGERIDQGVLFVDLRRETVGSATVGLLTQAQNEGKLRFVGSEVSIESINELGNATEAVSDTQIKAYGWCYSVNGQVPDQLPNQVYFGKQSDHLVWFYGYALFDRDRWVSFCVPSSYRGRG